MNNYNGACLWFFDVRGFYVGGVFHPREVALLGPKCVLSVSVLSNIDVSTLTKTDRDSMKYLERDHHGMKFVTSPKYGVTIGELQETVKHFYNIVRDEDDYLVAVKSKEAENILPELRIPRINILKYGGTYKEITTSDRLPCHLHAVKRRIIRCSLNIVIAMQEWYNNKGIKCLLGDINKPK